VRVKGRGWEGAGGGERGGVCVWYTMWLCVKIGEEEKERGKHPERKGITE